MTSRSANSSDADSSQISEYLCRSCTLKSENLAARMVTRGASNIVLQMGKKLKATLDMGGGGGNFEVNCKFIVIPPEIILSLHYLYLPSLLFIDSKIL